nr:Clp protease N-terminal domain-containing protein [Ammonifex thiophilus]
MTTEVLIAAGVGFIIAQTVMKILERKNHCQGSESPRYFSARFTRRAQKVLLLAQEEARRMNYPFVGTEHILLGLLREDEGVAAKALQNLGISADAVREKVERIVGRGEEPEVTLTPRAKRVLELVVEEMRQLGHNYVGTEHLLLGLIREGEGVAAQVLGISGADLDKVRTKVLEVLNAGAPGAT